MNVNTEEYQKDYSLLRPFDLEKAKNGELICWWEDGTKAEYIGECGMNNENDICVKYLEDSSRGKVRKNTYVMNESYYFRMAPLAWVEGKPVYKGDVLYGKNFPEYRYDVSHADDNNIFTIENETGSYCNAPENLTWNKPKQKKSKKVWGNIYPETDVIGQISYSGNWYGSEHIAKLNSLLGCIGQVELEINWEE